MKGKTNLRPIETLEVKGEQFLEEELHEAVKSLLRDKATSFVLAWGWKKKGASVCSNQVSWRGGATDAIGMIERAKARLIKELDG